MIFKGRKVLDGTLAEIQAQYGMDTIRVRVSGGAGALAGLGATVRDLGQLQEVRYAGDPQELLRKLLERGRVEHFEVGKPSLHDIFLRIAGNGA
jgi:ABC-2 type transport system ATP-binding protein